MFKRRNAIITIGFLGLMGMHVHCVQFDFDNPVDPANGDGTPPGVHTNAIRVAAVTISADYTAANFEIMSTEDYSVRKNLLNQLHTDLAVRAFGRGVYILERNGKDNIIKYDAKDMVIEYQQNLGTGLNIQDIAIISETKAYISCHNDNNMIVFDPKAGKKTSTIDLSRFNSYAGTDSAEASPFASALAVHGDYVYAACQRLKTVQESWGTNIVAGDTSLIVVIDARTDAVVKSIALNKKNPASMSILGSRMLVSCTGEWYDASTGGVEAIDLAGGVNTGIVVEGGQFGGSISNIAFVSSDKAYIAVGKMSGDFNYWTEIVPFDPSTGSVGAKIGGIGNGFGGLAYDGAKIYVGDRDLGASGIAVVNPNTNAVERKVPTGMLPSALAVIFPN